MKLKKDPRYLRSNKSIFNKGLKHKSSDVIWEKAPDIKRKVKNLITLSSLSFKPSNITCLRSYNSKSRAYARIWGLSKAWQITLNTSPRYIIEVLSEKYDSLPESKKDEVILHELAHIPNNFSGSLLPHIRHGKRSFKNKVDRLIKSVKYNNNKNI